MKTKITLALISLIAMTSCTKKWDWYDTDSAEKIELTESNYIFEGDLYHYALEIRIDSLQKRAEYLKEIIGNNQGTPAIEKEFEETVSNLEEASETAETVVVFNDLAEALGRRNPIGPRPPKPSVIPIGLEYILTHNLNEIDLTITDENEAELGKTEGDLYEVPGSKGILMYRKVKITNRISDGTAINVQRLNNQKLTDSYSIQVER